MPNRPMPASQGRWTTIDDNTGKPRSTVGTHRSPMGRSQAALSICTTKPNSTRCEKCPGDRKNQRIVGLEIIRGMKADGDEWENGTILDPETGKVYDCKLWLENGQLKVRGYVAFFYRTQTWVK
ncbi:MAG: DUF2147 domain-containing protein [Flavobacteriales bacterium]|nr:DUF2147 domain-containing protein [Flavobacteriales bacterium]